MSVSLKNVSLKNVQIAEVAFITSWQTDNVGTSNDDQITVPTVSTGSYNCVVYWGDGTTDTITTWDNAAWTHTYAGGAGTYTVRISGTFSGISFNDVGDKLKLLNISRWGGMKLGVAEGGYFYGCSNLTITATDILDLDGTTSLSKAFHSCASIITIPSINSWNFRDVEQYFSCFMNCILFNQNINLKNTLNGTGFSYMFRGCSSFDSPIYLNTSSATILTSMFLFSSIFNQDLSFMDTSSVTSMNSLLRSCHVFDQDLSSFDVTSLTTADRMLENVTLSTANYDAFLISAAAQAVQPNVPFHGGNSKYSAGAATTARGVLAGAPNNWIIIDGGQV